MKKLYVCDLDGTLTPHRESSADPFVLELLSNVEKMITALQANGKKIAIATNQRLRDESDEELSAFCFWVTKTLHITEPVMVATEVSPWMLKPSPCMILMLMQRYRLSAEEVVMIGNSKDDYLSAMNAGVDFMWADEFFGRK